MTVLNGLDYRIEFSVSLLSDDEFKLDERQERELVVLAEDNKVTIESILSIQTGTPMKSRQCTPDNICRVQSSQVEHNSNKLQNMANAEPRFHIAATSNLTNKEV